jgi:hypothetical protein
MPKTIFEVYGQQMTSYEDMCFSMYVDKHCEPMNTLYPEQRAKIAKEWLINFREKQDERIS